MPCNGDGSCLEQSDNKCKCNRIHLIGGSSIFDNYCPKECSHNCHLIECRNFKRCGQKRPQWLLNCNKGMCTDCAVEEYSQR
jgi:hypothetical protein